MQCLKLVAIGDSACGKTSLLTRLGTQRFESEYIPTEFDNHTSTLVIDGKPFNLGLWDTAGESDYDSMRPIQCYPQTNIFLICFNVSNRDSFGNVSEHWISEAKTYVKTASLFLLGLKTDERDRGQDDVTYSEAAKLAKKYKLLKYYECSAKMDSQEDIEELFRKVIKIHLQPQTVKIKCNSLTKLTLTSIQQLIELTKEDPDQRQNVIKTIGIKFNNGLEEDLKDIKKYLHDIFQLLLEISIGVEYKFAIQLVQDNPEVLSQVIMNSKPGLLLEQRDPNFLLAFFVTLESGLESIIERSINECNENIFHRLASQSYLSVCEILANRLDKKYIAKLMLTRSNNSKFPLILALNSDQEIASLFWITCETAISHEPSLASFLKIKYNTASGVGSKRSKKNILHLCGEANKFSIFQDICFSPILSKDDVLQMLNAPSSPFNLIADDSCMTHILERFGLNSFSESTKQQIFNTICKHNMRQAMELFKNNIVVQDVIKYAKAKDDQGINAFMMAAIASSDHILMTLIVDIFLTKNCTVEEINEFLHDQDPEGRTLLNIIIAQGEALTFAREMIIKIERDFHRSEKGSKTIIPLVQCFQDKLGPSRDVAKALKDEKSYLTPTDRKFRTWVKVFLELLIPLSIYLQDVITDSFLTERYYEDFMNPTQPDKTHENCSETILPLIEDLASTKLQLEKQKLPNTSILPLIEDLSQIPKELKPGPIFYYSLAFLLLPIGCYFFEWYFQESQRLTRELTDLRLDIDKSIWHMILTPFITLFWLLVHFFWILFWPLINLLKNYFTLGQYKTAVGEAKTAKHIKLEQNRTQSVRAHMFEVCIESTFQPLLQIYLYLPSFLKNVVCLSVKAIKEKQELPRLQFLAIVTSVFSLTFSFTKYFIMQQNGAMDLDFNPCGCLMILISTLMQILGRAVCLTLFTYTFGAGNFWPLMVFIAAHVLLITLLQTLFDFLIWKEFSLQSLFDNIFCGISNIYFHNQINQYANRKKSNQKSVNGLQLAQQLVIESIIILENVVMLVLVILDETLQNNTLVIGLVIGNFMLYLLGLALKMGYYKFFYIWNDVLWTDLKTLKADLVKVMRNK